MSHTIITCPICSKEVSKRNADIVRANKEGLKLFCGKACFGISRRRKEIKTPEQLKKEKAEYDRLYRKNNSKMLKKKKKAYYEENKSIILPKHKAYRDIHMQRHVEYCRRPEYKVYKKQFDHKYRLEKKYGEYWEAASILVQLKKELDSKQIKYDNGLINKKQKRTRAWKI